MIFEWDEAKRLANIEKHGVDFIRAALVFADPHRVEVPDTREEYGEARFIVVGLVGEGELYALVHTLRGKAVRVISAWKVGEDGKRRYQALHARRTTSTE